MSRFCAHHDAERRIGRPMKNETGPETTMSHRIAGRILDAPSVFIKNAPKNVNSMSRWAHHCLMFHVTENKRKMESKCPHNATDRRTMMSSFM